MEQKAFWTSTTFWGVFLMVVSSIVAKSPDQVAFLASSETAETAANFAFLVSSAVALWGRKKATAPLGLSTK